MASVTLGDVSLCSLSDRENIILIGRIDDAVIAECPYSVFKLLLVHLLLDKVPDVALVDELVRLGALLHHFKDELLRVARVCIKP